jgi:hypothetical protein
VVWCGVVWCGVVWCGVVWCGVVCVYANARWYKEQASRRKCVVSVLLTNPYRIRVSEGLAIPTQ